MCVNVIVRRDTLLEVSSLKQERIQGRVILPVYTYITVTFLSRDWLYQAYIISRPNAIACVTKYHRLHSTSCTTEPAAIVDHFTGSGARRLRFG